MRKRVQVTKMLAAGLIFFAVIMSGNCEAQEMLNQNERLEIFVLIQSMGGDTAAKSDFEKLELELDDTVAGGLGIGYNLNENLNVNFDMFFASTDMTGKYYSRQAKVDTDMIGMDVNLEFNILKRADTPVTPLITGGIGCIRFENDDLKIGETDFSYNLGAGVRWEITKNFFIKGIYRATWTKLEDSDGNIMLDGMTLNVGYIF